MKNNIKRNFVGGLYAQGLRLGLFFLLACNLINHAAQAQCSLYQLTHDGGIQTVGCTDVEVIPDGAVDFFTPSPCFYGPYAIGRLGSGSITFTFSVPVSSVKIDVQTITIGEEFILEVNGVFYPITIPGTTPSCQDGIVFISPPGVLRCNSNGAWKDIIIPGPISRLTIINNPYANISGFSVNVFICCPSCSTDAGSIVADRLDNCVDELASPPPAQATALDANDMLQYILFSDIANILGSTLATSSTPEFAFNPATMTLGTTYFIVAVAGNILNGDVDPNDPCLDFSNTVEVAWWGPPTVAFTSDAECLVPEGCFDITAVFTGSPPYQLSGQVLSWGNVLTTFTGAYSANSVINICLPLSTPSGPIDVVATYLSDAHCTCE